MKKIYTLLTLLLLTASVFLTQRAIAQAPQKMSYQSVIRNSSNALLVNTAVGIKISVLQGSASGNPVYTETQTATTNANGLMSIQIGTGTVSTGTFAGIDWAAGPYFIKTETDPAGGTNYTITGTQEMLSVPYAMYAAKAANGLSPGSRSGDMLYWDGNAWTSIPAGLNGQSLMMISGKPMWLSTSNYYIGMPFGGGKIAYILQPGDFGYTPGATHGLIAAESDQSTGSTWNFAASICNDLVLNAYDDWFLPSSEELYKMFIAKDAIGGFFSSKYWSSTSIEPPIANSIDFGTGFSSESTPKNQYHRVRAVRAF